MTDDMLGKWKTDSSRVEGYKEFMEATGHPPEADDSAEFTLDISKSGNTMTLTTEKTGKSPFTMTFTFGETLKKELPDGLEMELSAQQEGDKLQGEVKISGVVIKHKMYLNDKGELVQEQTCNGKSMSTRYSRA